MNLDKYIKILLMTLSQKYDISIVEIQKAKNGKIGKNYTVNYKTKKDKVSSRKSFKNKRDMVSWLICLS